MYDSLEQIDLQQDKVKKIIQVGYEIFARNDVEKASISMIVKKAGISRGIFYHYFEDKDMLFDLLIYLSVKESIVALDETIDWDKDDLLERFAVMTKQRIRLTTKYPQMVDFLTKYKHMTARYQGQFPQILDWKGKFYHKNVDYNKFKPSEHLHEHLRIASFTFKGVINEFIVNYEDVPSEKTIAHYIESCDKYYETLCQLLYK